MISTLLLNPIESYVANDEHRFKLTVQIMVHKCGGNISKYKIYQRILGTYMFFHLLNKEKG